MAETITIESPLPPRELLDRLAAFGTNWRESKMPASARSKGYHQCRTKVRETCFELELGPRGRGPGLIWCGWVQPITGGSRVEIVWKLTRGTFWTYAILSVIIVAVWAMPQILAGSIVFPLIGLAMMSGGVAAAIA